MKKSILLICLLFLFSLLSAQNTKAAPIQDPKVPFRLFETSNLWTFIMLDTTTGKMWLIQYEGSTWQVQWSWEKENMFVIPIN